MIGMRHWRVLYRCPVQRALILIRNEARGSAKWAENGSNRDSSWWIILLPALPYFMVLLSLFFMIRQEFERICIFLPYFAYLIWMHRQQNQLPRTSTSSLASGDTPSRHRFVCSLNIFHPGDEAGLAEITAQMNMKWTWNEHEMNMKWTWNEHEMNMKWTWNEHEMNMKWTWNEHEMNMKWTCSHHVRIPLSH